MAHPVRHHYAPLNALASFLNSDGRTHPVQNSLVAATLVFGAVAFTTAQFDHLNLVSSWTGLLGILSGAYGQMISATTGERFLLIIGLGAAAFGFYLGMAHGGLFG
jgi:hypothetical protein